MKNLLVCVALLVATTPVWAAPQTVTLSVKGMNCAACPITVKKALSKVNGVSRVGIQFEKRTAVVTFDNSKTKILALTQATKNAGYPSTAMK